jgi:hypothetical protein
MTDSERDILIAQTHALTTRLAHVIEGNGQPGLLQRVNIIETRQIDCPAKDAFKGQSKRMAFANTIQVAMVLVTVIAALIAIFA